MQFFACVIQIIILVWEFVKKHNSISLAFFCDCYFLSNQVIDRQTNMKDYLTEWSHNRIINGRKRVLTITAVPFSTLWMASFITCNQLVPKLFKNPWVTTTTFLVSWCSFSFCKHWVVLALGKFLGSRKHSVLLSSSRYNLSCGAILSPHCGNPKISNGGSLVKVWLFKSGHVIFTIAALLLRMSSLTLLWWYSINTGS